MKATPIKHGVHQVQCILRKQIEPFLAVISLGARKVIMCYSHKNNKSMIKNYEDERLMMNNKNEE